MHSTQFGADYGEQPILAKLHRRTICRILEILRVNAERNCHLLSIDKLENEYRRCYDNESLVVRIFDFVIHIINRHFKTIVPHLFDGKSLIDMLKDELSKSVIVIENADPIMIQLRSQPSVLPSQAMVPAPSMMLQQRSHHPLATYGIHASCCLI